MENIGQIYTGINGNIYTAIEPALGKGGEGSVHEILGNSLSVVKIFNKKQRTKLKHEKLLAMINTPLSMAVLQQIIWPIDVLYDNNHNFVGYVMPKLRNNEDFNDLNVISHGCVECTLHEKIVIAKNLCCVLSALHDAEIICGDLNPNNIIANKRTGLVNFIDTDSYCIRDRNSGKVFRCEVGMPEYFAKEIHETLHDNKGNDLRTLSISPYTKETDRFALAIHIFELLMNGCHPFACAIDINTDDNTTYEDNWNPFAHAADENIDKRKSLAAPQPMENIRNGFFPFYMKKNNIKTPLYAPNFDFLPKNLREMFIKAFTMTPKDRPSAEEWFKELDKAQEKLKACKNNKKHTYFNHQDTCFFCESEKQKEHLHEIKKNSISIPQLYSCEPHKVCILLLDVSESMGGAKIHCLNEGVMRFLSQVTTDELTNSRVDLSIIAFNDCVKTVQDFTPVYNVTMPILKTSGGKDIVKAINISIDKIRERKQFYNSIGVPCFCSEVIIFTDGLFADDISQIANKIKLMERQDKLHFWSVGVPGYNLKILTELSGNKIIELKNYDFTGFFNWSSDDDGPCINEYEEFHELPNEWNVDSNW